MAENPRSPSPGPFISVIIPALDEEVALPATLGALAGQIAAPPHEVILVDGGSGDRTLEVFREATAGWTAAGIRATAVVSAPPGRAVQMNTGARWAKGEALVFLHADTLLPPDGLRLVAEALDDPRVVGGGFRLSFGRTATIGLRVIAAWATARSRLTRVHYGDQAPFLRRTVFEALGGFPDLPLFEDLALARALRRRGRVVTLAAAAVTSARRLRRGGVGRTAIRFAFLKASRRMGVHPEWLRSKYPDVR